LIIDHNLLIAPEDHNKKGIIFVGGQLKSQPDELWLLNFLKQWNKVVGVGGADFYGFYEKLPMVAPISIFTIRLRSALRLAMGRYWSGMA
jgi:hypothetical protein